eukprot:383892-Rhodomonas_salina.4
MPNIQHLQFPLPQRRDLDESSERCQSRRGSRFVLPRRASAQSGRLHVGCMSVACRLHAGTEKGECQNSFHALLSTIHAPKHAEQVAARGVGAGGVDGMINSRHFPYGPMHLLGAVRYGLAQEPAS